MITWPIFVGLILAVIAVYASINAEQAKIIKEKQAKDKEELKRIDLKKRKQRLENENNFIV